MDSKHVEVASHCPSIPENRLPLQNRHCCRIIVKNREVARLGLVDSACSRICMVPRCVDGTMLDIGQCKP